MTHTSTRLAVALQKLSGLDGKAIDEWTGPERERVVKWLYDILSILDAKSSHVLRTSAISLAAQTFLVGVILQTRIIEFPLLAGYRDALLVGSLLIPLIASAVALNVFQVEWLFLERYYDSSGKGALNVEIEELAAACDKRTSAHQTAWRLSMLASGTLASIIIVATLSELAMGAP